MTKARIIEHKTFSGTTATASSAHCIAETCGRQAVNAQWLWENPDVTGFMYDKELGNMGLDPWTLITGLDANRDGSKIILESGMTGERTVEPDFEVYVSRRATMQLNPDMPKHIAV